jgi:hypothetical protein
MRWVDIEVPNSAVDMNSRALLACYPRGSFYPLSFDNPMIDQKITKSHFRDCSTCRSNSKAFLYLCALKPDFHPGWEYLWIPPLLFRREPSQLNCPPYSVPDLDNKSGLVLNIYKGGITLLTPPRLASQLRSLPPILYTQTSKTK